MIFYLASRYNRREELCGYRSDLETRGHRVPARWLRGEHQVRGLAAAAAEADGPVPLAQGRPFAEDDMLDLPPADALVAFTEHPGSGAARGGRRVELGVALGLRYVRCADKPIYVVGPRENVFHCLSHTQQFDTWSDFLECIDKDDEEASDVMFL